MIAMGVLRSILFPALILFCGVTPLPAKPAPASSSLAKQSLDELEARLSVIDDELARLAHFTLRSGVGNVGWISNRRAGNTAKEWIQVELPPESVIDQIVLAPLLWNDAHNGPQADGLPEEFIVIAGKDGDTKGNIVARLGPEDHFLPRIAPVVIPIPPTEASWVRVQSLRLSPDARTGRHTFGLSELLVFSGARNLALNQPVSVSSSIGGWGKSGIYKEGLVDGSTPFLMDASSGANSNTFKAFSNSPPSFSAVIDLGKVTPVDGIRVHGADLSEHVPQLTEADFGMPTHFLIQGANKANFSDAVDLWEHRPSSIFASGPILGQNFPTIPCRYIRFLTKEPYRESKAANEPWSVILAEIEVLSNGLNVSAGKNVRLPRRKALQITHLEALTDGRNHFGEILPYREWLGQLARRHDLEKERPPIATAIKIRYTEQKAKLAKMSWLILLLTAGIIFTFLIDRMIRMRTIAKLKERIAADMHDELGANIHTIGLLSDSARVSRDSDTEWETLHQRIRLLTEQTGRAIRRCSKVVDTTSDYTGLAEDMERTAQRITGQFEHRITFEGLEHIGNYSPRTQIDIFLFYKECLINIYRHSHATRFETHLTASPRQITLSVSDNGKGIPGALPEGIPPSLKRRARLARGKLTITDGNETGTLVTLKVRKRRWHLLG